MSFSLLPSLPVRIKILYCGAHAEAFPLMCKNELPCYVSLYESRICFTRIKSRNTESMPKVWRKKVAWTPLHFFFHFANSFQGERGSVKNQLMGNQSLEGSWTIIFNFPITNMKFPIYLVWISFAQSFSMEEDLFNVPCILPSILFGDVNDLCGDGTREGSRSQKFDLATWVFINVQIPMIRYVTQCHIYQPALPGKTRFDLKRGFRHLCCCFVLFIS